MYFVIQVKSTSENEMMNSIKRIVDEIYISDIFIPTRVRMKKAKGSWQKYQERWFPGYIFVETNKPKELARELRKVDGFTKLVGFGNIGNITYTPLSKKDENLINRLMNRENKESVISLSKIEIDEGKKIRVIDGPLLGFEGTVIKYNFHKRTALVDMDFNGNVVSVQLGIEIIEKKR